MSAGRKSVTSNKDWCTPKKYVDVIKKMWNGKIDLDPCSNIHSIVKANMEFMLPHQDGLGEDWGYGAVYVNPPYGNCKERGTSIRDWFKKIANSYKKFDNEIIALVPVATNTSHWKKYVFPIASSICFLYDTRLKFIIDGTSDNKGAPMSCCMIYYGKNYMLFMETFAQYGAALPLYGIKYPSSEVDFEFNQIGLFEAV